MGSKQIRYSLPSWTRIKATFDDKVKTEDEAAVIKRRYSYAPKKRKERKRLPLVGKERSDLLIEAKKKIGRLPTVFSDEKVIVTDIQEIMRKKKTVNEDSAVIFRYVTIKYLH